MADGEPEACWRPVVEDVHRKLIEAYDLGEAVDHASNVVECVTEFFSRRHVGLTKPRKVRRDHEKSIGEQRDQITKHMARASGSRAATAASVHRPAPLHDRRP